MDRTTEKVTQADAMIGKRLLHYKIRSRLGSGGMGEVYEAEDLKLGRPVAIKMLPRRQAIDPERFRHEARVLATLNHPNIVTLHAIEQTDEAQFLVMEKVEGRSLNELVPAEGLANDRFLDLAISLCEAAAAAHQKGILHRDLKPGNIMVEDDGGLKVLDFGLAQPTGSESDDGEEEEVTATTSVSTVSGTVPYMAPELLKGFTGDHRSDIFSLGVILYQMAAGRRPFNGDSSIEVLVAIIKDEPKPLDSIRPDLPRGLAEVIARCLEKEPKQRFAETQELVTELRRIRAGVEPSSMEIPIRELLAKRFGSQRMKRRALAVAALVVATVAALSTLEEPKVDVPSNERKLVAILPFDNLGPAEDDYFALGITEEITSRLGSIRDLGVIARSSSSSFHSSGLSPSEIGRALGADYVLDGSVRWSSDSDGRRVRVTPRLIQAEDSTQLWSAAYERVLEDIFAVQTEIAVQVTDQLNVTLFPAERRALESRPTRNLEAYEAYLRGQEEAVHIDRPDAQRRAAELLERAVELDPGFVEGWAELAWTHAKIFHFGLDRSAERRAWAVEAYERALALDPSSPEARLAKANVLYWTQRDYAGALRELGIARRRAPNDTRIIEAEGFILRRLGRLDDALNRLREAAKLNPLSSDLKREIGNTLFFMRRCPQALQAYDQAIELAVKPDQGLIYKARCLWHMGRLDQAGQTLDRLRPSDDEPMAIWFKTWHEIYSERWDAALALLANAQEPFFQWTTTYYPLDLLRGFIEQQMGDSAAAKASYQRAFEQVEAELAKLPDDPRLISSRALVVARLGRRDEALRDAWRAVEKQPLEADAIDGSDYRLRLAQVLTVIGDYDSALDELELLLCIPSQVSAPWLRLDPTWAPLRSNPRFQTLLETRPVKR